MSKDIVVDSNAKINKELDEMLALGPEYGPDCVSGDDIPDDKAPTFADHLSDDLQDQLLAHILHDASVLETAARVIDPRAFTQDSARLAARLAFEYYTNFGKPIPKDLLTAEFEQQSKDKKHRVTMLSHLQKCYEYLPFEAPEYWCGRALELGQRFKIGKAYGEFQKQPDFNKLYAAIDEAKTCGNVQKDYELADRAALKAMKPLVWQVGSHFPVNSTVCVFGPSGSGKSFWCLDAGLCVIKGIPFLGQYETVQGTVLYISSEGAGGLDNRLSAWLEAHGFDIDDPCEGIVFSTITHDFQDRANLEKLIAKATAKLGKIDLVFVDTLSRNFGAGDADHNADMQAYLRGVDFVRETTGATVVSIHHTGWANIDRERGAKSLRDYCDSTIAVIGDEATELVDVICKKQKDDAKFAPYTLAKRSAQNSLWLEEVEVDDEERTETGVPAETVRNLLALVPNLKLGTTPTKDLAVKTKVLVASAKQKNISERQCEVLLNDLLSRQIIQRIGSKHTGWHYFQVSDISA